MPYLDEVLKQAGNLDLSKGGVFQMNIAHDDWCDLLKGKGSCNCNPTVSPAKERKSTSKC